MLTGLKTQLKSTASAPAPDRWWDLPSAFLLFIALTAAFLRLIATQWTEDLTITRTIVYLGLIAGLALGYSRFRPSAAAFFAIVYGLFVVTWRLGMTMETAIGWTERLRSLAGRLHTIIGQLAQGRVVTDNLLFLVLMAALFWMLSLHAGYSLTRYASPWRIILPTGLAITVIHAYDPLLVRRSWYLVIYLFFGLVLVARLVYLHQHRRWEQNRTYLPPQLGSDFIRIALLATALLLILSWTAPALADTLPAAQDIWLKARRPLQGVRDVFDKAFASLRSTVGVVSDSYGSSMALGRGSQLTDAIVFKVQGPAQKPNGVRYYWRARVYDEYTQGSWKSAAYTDVKTVSPSDFGLTIPPEPSHDLNIYPFSFTAATPMITLYTAPQVTWLSRPVRVEMALNEDSSADIAVLRASPSLHAGETYSTRASLSTVTISQMKKAGTDYPDWVRQRYLQIPPDFSLRVAQLARDVTAELPTPYDKAAAITNWLRANISYRETIPAPPAGRDPLEWFLFDLKEGFCNYYATAEVMMLRSVGIPARLAVGYAQGEVEELTEIYTVRQRDAHAWPEVYFPSLGWVEFEPTVSQGELVRPLGTDTNNTTPELNATPESLRNPNGPGANQRNQEDAAVAAENRAVRTRQLVILGAVLLSLALLLAPLFWRGQLARRLPSFPLFLESSFRRLGMKPPRLLRDWARRVTLSPVAKAYLEINHALRRLGQPAQPKDTPAERVEALCRLLPVAQSPAQRLLAEYQSATYSRQAADLQAARQASSEIRSLSYRAAFQRLMAGKRAPVDEKEDLYRSMRW
jgi:transglutaminase-like putative cysteine protease